MGFESAGFLEEDDADEEADDAPGRATVSLGAITHGFLAFKARLSRRRGSGCLLSSAKCSGLKTNNLGALPGANRCSVLVKQEIRMIYDEIDAKLRYAAPAARRRLRLSEKAHIRAAATNFLRLNLLAPGPKERAPALLGGRSTKTRACSKACSRISAYAAKS